MGFKAQSFSLDKERHLYIGIESKEMGVVSLNKNISKQLLFFKEYIFFTFTWQYTKNAKKCICGSISFSLQEATQ